MPDHSLSTDVTLSGGGASGYGTVPTPTADQISNAQAAIDALSVDIDTLLTAGITIYLVPDSFFAANDWTSSGDKPYGYSPTATKKFVSNELGLTKQRYTILHEIFHSVDSAIGVMNSAKRATVAGQMKPNVNTGVAGYWGLGQSSVRPSEAAANTFPAAYAGMEPLDYYTRKIAASSYSAFVTAVGGAGAPAATTLNGAVLAGAATITVTSAASLAIGDWILIGGVERHQIINKATNVLTLDVVLTLGFANGTAVVETGPTSDVSSGVVDVPVVRTTANGATQSYAFTGLAPATSGTARIRFKDGSEWGPWSDPASVLLTGEPGPPINVTVEAGTLTPDIGFSINSYPGDAITWYQIIVSLNVNGVSTTLWNHIEDDVSPQTRVNVTYAGAPLAYDQTYYLNISYHNFFDAESPNSLTTFTPTADVGPVITYLGDSLTTDYKIDTLTPTFVLSHRTASNIDEARLRLWDSAGTSLVWDSGLIGPFTPAANKSITVASGYLTWGMNLKVDGFVRLSGSTDPDSYSVEKFSIHINAAPGAPYPVSVSSETGQVVLRSDGVWVTTDPEPDILFPFRDVDLDMGYDEDPERQEVEVRDSDLVAFGSSPYIDASSPSETFTSPTLDLEATFDFRARYDDSASVRSDWSARAFVKYSAAPELSSVTPADAATVTDPTQTIAWIYSSNGDKPQAGYQLTGSVAGGVIYDSGLIASDADSADFPPFTLPNATEVVWTLTVYDTDGLFTQEVRSFTTSFTQPAALTGLAVTPDADLKALLVEWDESVLPDEEFYSYSVFAKSGDAQFRLVTTLYEKTTTSLYYRAAAHNAESVIYVTQSNGWMDSDPAVASATLGGVMGESGAVFGYWDVGADGAFDLRHIQHGPGDTQSLIEQFAPPGRHEKILLNWGSTGYEGSFTLLTDDRELVLRLRRYKDSGEVRLLKTPYGAVRYVKYTSTPDTDRPVGWINNSVTYIEVEPASADF